MDAARGMGMTSCRSQAGELAAGTPLRAAGVHIAAIFVIAAASIAAIAAAAVGDIIVNQATSGWPAWSQHHFLSALAFLVALILDSSAAASAGHSARSSAFS